MNEKFATPLFAIVTLGIAIFSTVCAKRTRPDRNYWPMQRVMWSVIGFVYYGALINIVLHGSGGLQMRIIFSVVVLCAMIYSSWFMNKRNNTPRFIQLSIDGHEHFLALDELRIAATITTSFLRHGSMPKDWIPEIEEALQDWHNMDNWRQELARQTLQRREEMEVAQTERIVSQ